MSTSLRTSVIRLAHLNPELRPFLLPILASSRTALTFDSKKEMEEYRKDHDVKPGTKLEVKEKGDKKDSKGHASIDTAEVGPHEQAGDHRVKHHEDAKKKHQERAEHHKNKAEEHDKRHKEMKQHHQEAVEDGESEEEIRSLSEAARDAKRESDKSHGMAKAHEDAADAHGEASRAHSDYGNGDDDSEKARKKPNELTNKARKHSDKLKHLDKE